MRLGNGRMGFVMRLGWWRQSRHLARQVTALMAAVLAALASLHVPQARANSAAADYFRTRADRSAVPRLLTEDERAYYKQMFAAIRARDWTTVQTLFVQKTDGPLHNVARGEYFLAPGSPRIDADTLTQWLAGSVGLPEAEPISSLAAKRGVTSLPPLPLAQQLVALPTAPRRSRPRDVVDGTMPGPVAAGIIDRIKRDDPVNAKIMLDGIDSVLSAEARAEWRQRIAWSFYIENDDADAYAVAVAAGAGGPSPAILPPPGFISSTIAATNGGPTPTQAASPVAPSYGQPTTWSTAVSGAWTAEGWWTAGLAAWRMGDCMAAGNAFAQAALTASNPELSAAGFYWQSRAAVRCRAPEQASAPLRRAAAYDETLYGMLAAEQLGMRFATSSAGPDFTAADWQSLRDIPNVRTAVALAEIGEDGIADEVLRYQARIGDPTQYQPLSRLARDLGLPAAQLWMAYNAPAGGTPAAAARYPMPKWTPSNGWQVDPALVLAHSLQESQFRVGAVSPAGARGLMQIMPSAARDHAADLGVAGNNTDLSNPEINLALGQIHLQALRNSAVTQGLLPKVVAAYNAGLQPVGRWNSQIHADGDPLLWMESVPYWETRGYVSTVLRNYWMYERQAGGPSESRIALAEGMWPTFPGLTGAQAVRMSANGATRMIRSMPDAETRLADGD